MLGRDCVSAASRAGGKSSEFIPRRRGTAVGDIKANFNVPDLEELIVEVIDTVSVKEREVQEDKGAGT